MADSLGLATLIVALCAIAFTLSPVSINFAVGIFSTVLRATYPSLGTCERLEWQDVPDGPLHTCSLPRSCNHIGTADITPSWERTIATFFRMRRRNFVRKPKQLHLTTTYIRTDTKTLRVFLSLLNLRTVSNPRDVGEEPFRIVFKEVEGILTAYMQIRQPPPIHINGIYRLDVTKREMELILQGYPPWYQNPLRLPAGRAVHHPIRDQSDLSRGGWIVAVGLSPTLPVAAECMDKKEGSVAIVDQALDRVIHCLENLEKAFPEQERVSVACRVAKKLRSRHGRFGFSRSSFIYLFKDVILRAGELPDLINDWTYQQINTVMAVFSQYEPLTSEQTAELRPILETALRVALFGVYQVFKHLYVSGLRDDLPYIAPPHLERHDFVYVRERWVSVED